MSELCSGTVTFLFTEIEGSTHFLEEYPEEMRSALARYDSIVAVRLAPDQRRPGYSRDKFYPASQFIDAGGAEDAAWAAILRLEGLTLNLEQAIRAGLEQE